MRTCDSEQNALEHDFPSNSKILESFWFDHLRFGENFKQNLKENHSYDREENENAEEQIACEEDVRKFNLADETDSIYSSHRKMLEALCHRHLSISTGIQRAFLDLDRCCGKT